MGKKNRNKRDRNRSSNSSISDLETSFNIKKQKTITTFEDSKNTKLDVTIETMAESNNYDVAEQLKQINKKLENVITKDDTFLKNLIKDVILEMRSEIFSSIEKKLEIMETQMFDYVKENAQLKTQIIDLKKTIEAKDNDHTDRINTIERVVRSHGELHNDQAQYSRRNNVRIHGLPEMRGETAEQTAQKVISILNEKIPNLNLMINDIDIAHRIGKPNQSTEQMNLMELRNEMKNGEGKNRETSSVENENNASQNKDREKNSLKKDETTQKNKGNETMAEILKKK
jgi:phage terminase Nu1 subunit (DNA packaging protein)